MSAVILFMYNTLTALNILFFSRVQLTDKDTIGIDFFLMGGKMPISVFEPRTCYEMTCRHVRKCCIVPYALNIFFFFVNHSFFKLFEDVNLSINFTNIYFLCETDINVY